ncbi:hypothetical protein ACFZBE_17970 [Streptomyces sp. NPDC008061]|uniref:hypothetical protein n=1 Tax=Streptomyces sp. NPDC008061 TaxID=3364805 RepID=UPI0036EF83FB
MNRNAWAVVAIVLAIAAAIQQAIALHAYDVRPGLISSAVLSILANGLWGAHLIRRGRRNTP